MIVVIRLCFRPRGSGRCCNARDSRARSCGAGMHVHPLLHRQPGSLRPYVSELIGGFIFFFNSRLILPAKNGVFSIFKNLYST